MNDSTAQMFRVEADTADQTLAAALRKWLNGSSWKQVRKLVDSRRVTVSGNVCLDDARRLRADEVVKILPFPASAPPKQEDVRIRHVDAQVVVVEKPAGMTSIRYFEERTWPNRRKQIQPTLDELLPKILARSKGQPQRRGTSLPKIRPVHRLDRETSGLMVFARTVEAERFLGQQFRKHAIHRRYLAVVQGVVEEQTFESHLIRDRGDGRRGSTELANAGKRAITHVRPLERLGDYTLIECHLETGRTHQIRIHCSENKTPVCGDKVYFQPLFAPPLMDRSGAPRLALHAAELGFEHPSTRDEMFFQMPLPPDLDAFLNRLRRG